MRAALIVTGLGATLAAGCGPLLGIDDRFTSPDTPGTPGTPDAPGTPPVIINHVGVVGHSSITYHTELAAMTMPEDLSQLVIDAYVFDDVGLHVYPGSGAADGTFEIPDVPARDYHLRLVPKAGGLPAIWHLVGHDVDLSRDDVGHPDQVNVEIPSPVSLTTPAMQRYLSRDALMIYSSLSAKEFLPAWADREPQLGLDRLSDAKLDWAGHPALDNNGVWIVHHGVSQTQSDDLDIATATEAAHIAGVHQTAGELVPLAFTFGRGTTASATMAIDISALRPPRTALESAALVISATPDGGTGTRAGPELLRASYRAPIRAPVAVHLVDYADPFPASWSRAAVVTYQSLSRLYFQPPQVILPFGDLVTARQVAAPGAELVVPSLVARPPGPTGITLDGAPIADAVHAPGDPLRVAWDAVPAATSYSVSFVVIAPDGHQDTVVMATTVPALVVPAGTFPDQRRILLSVGVASGSPLEPAIRRAPLQQIVSEHTAALLLISSTCGNGTVDPGEACDTAGESATCNFDCTMARCGDTITNAAAHEDCDLYVTTRTCDAQCHTVVCGDGVLAPNGVLSADGGEQCDDGNTLDGDGCNSDCQVESLLHCGNQVVDPGEQCDDGNLDDLDICSTQCKYARCGDGVVASNAGETCDDHNFTSGDGCTAYCVVERCGDGLVIYPEECDDTNNVSGDGCSADCRLE